MVNRSHLRVVPDPSQSTEPSLSIDCDECVMQHTPTCADCVVSHVVGHEAGAPLEFASDEARAVRLLVEAGLVPNSRFERQQTGA